MSELLTTFGINGKLLLIQAVNFGVLLAALWYFLYRPVMAMIDARKAKIAEGVALAEAAHEKRAQADAEYETIVTGATQEAEELVAAARERADAKGGEMVREAQQRAQGILIDAATRAEEARKQSLAESKKDIARAAILAAEKILREGK